MTAGKLLSNAKPQANTVIKKQKTKKQSTNGDKARLLARFHSARNDCSVWLLDSIMHVHW